MPMLDRKQFGSPEGLRYGAYIMVDTPQGKPELILIVGARQTLQKLKIAVRLVSMPSWELFKARPRQYSDSLLPLFVRKRLAVEAGGGTSIEESMET